MEKAATSEPDIYVPQFDAYSLHKCLFPDPPAIPTNLDELRALIISRQHETWGEGENPLDANAQLPSLTTALGSYETTTWPIFPNETSTQSLMQVILESAQRIQELFPTLEILTLPQGKPGSVELTYEQVHCLLSNMFICNMPRLDLPQVKHPELLRHYLPNYGSLTMITLYLSHNIVGVQRVLALIHYFYKFDLEHRALVEETQGAFGGVLRFERYVLNPEEIDLVTREKLNGSGQAIPEELAISMHSSGVEDIENAAMVNFANMQLHVGAIWPCATQEENLFTIHPECFVGIPFCQTMADNEAIVISGARRFSTYTGFQGSFRITGDYPVPLARQPGTKIISIDACTPESVFDQVSSPLFERDVLKAYLGFRDVRGGTVATGNWGCGAFGGNPQVKFVQQVIAASMAGVSLAYGSPGMTQEFMNLWQRTYDDIKTKKLSMSDLTLTIKQYGKTLSQDRSLELFEHIHHSCWGN